MGQQRPMVEIGATGATSTVEELVNGKSMPLREVSHSAGATSAVEELVKMATQMLKGGEVKKAHRCCEDKYRDLIEAQKRYAQLRQEGIVSRDDRKQLKEAESASRQGDRWARGVDQLSDTYVRWVGGKLGSGETVRASLEGPDAKLKVANSAAEVLAMELMHDLQKGLDALHGDAVLDVRTSEAFY